jgi:hypothetical protein
LFIVVVVGEREEGREDDEEENEESESERGKFDRKSLGLRRVSLLLLLLPPFPLFFASHTT